MYQRKRIREIDRLSGSGTLETADKRKLPVKYELRIRREMVEAGPGEELAGLLDIKGCVEPGISGTFLEPRTEFTLTLSDGGKIEIIIKSVGYGSFDIEIKDAHEFARRYEKS